MKIRRVLFLGGAVIILLLVLAMDIIRKSVAFEFGGLDVLRDVLVFLPFLLLFLLLEATVPSKNQTPMKSLGFLIVVTIVMVVWAIGLGVAVPNGFDAKSESLIPLDYGTLFVATILAVGFSIFSVLVMRFLRTLVLFKRKKGTQRNLFIFVLLMFGSSISTLWLRPLESSVITSVLFGLAVTFAIANSFRLSWIVYLTKREKVFALIYTFFLFLGFTALNVVMRQSELVNSSLLYYSYPLRQFASITCIFGNTYFGMAFVSTLFHLPTAEAFDRKSSEVSSLHNLSRLVTQVFDFNELVETVTSMTLQVCEAQSCWLEMIHTSEDDRDPGSAGRYLTRVVAMQHITAAEIEALVPMQQRTLRDSVITERVLIVIDDVKRDSRFAHVKKSELPVASMVVAPLVSHQGLIGILYVTKSMVFGFFKDDVDAISAFADQATIAIENSRLIEKSIERERLMREMVLAQEMQKRLLPQSVPTFATLEIDAISTPAFEVGGDYYDFIHLDASRVGVVVGDVSGKGVSAAFYMSEVKGIFQAIGRMYPSPREFMIRANEALSSSIDKQSFVSLIYAVIDTSSGVLTLSRAGHCPMLLLSGESGSFVRPGGMGMGLSGGETFADAMEETSIVLKEGDVCILYTDGVTEARIGEDEFGYERLKQAAQRAHRKSASAIKEEILETVRTYTDHQASHDDLTLVVVKWLGKTHLS